MNPDDGDLRNAAHLGEISSNQGVEKMEELEADLETLRGEVRRRGEGAGSSRSSRRQWRWRFRRRSREREKGRKRVDERWVSAGRRGIHDDVVDLTSGSNAGVRVPNGSQVSRWSTKTARSASIQTKRWPTDRATLTEIISQTNTN